jgi:hypothetical protein
MENQVLKRLGKGLRKFNACGGVFPLVTLLLLIALQLIRIGNSEPSQDGATDTLTSHLMQSRENFTGRAHPTPTMKYGSTVT